MSLSSNFPAIKPSLLLDFANTKQLDPRVTFARATTATYYDGVTTAKAEENLFTRSQEFDSADWSKTATTVTANAATAPDGTSTADQMIETADTSNHRIQQGMNATNGLTYTFSVFAKKGVLASARNFIQLAVPTTPFGVNAYANFDILNGTIPTQGAGLVSAAITNVGSGWYRCSIVATATSTIAANFWIQIAQSGTDAILPSYAGSTSADVLLWGAQVEQRSSVTAYTPTTTAPITNYIPVLMTAASGVPRFDHNPTTDESLGLLIEEQRTNSLTYSEDLNNAAWTVDNTGTLVANQAIAPTGTLTADLVRDSTSSGAPRLIRTSPFNPGGSSFTYSIYVKSYGAKRNVFLLAQESANAFYAHFDIVAGTVVQSSGNGPGTLISAVIQSVGNGWFRISISGTTPGSTSTYLIAHSEAPGSTGFGAGNYTGDGFSGVLFWGAQLETNSAPFATSYIPTVASTVTRNADAASMTGTNFSSWYSIAGGTLFGAYRIAFTSGTRYLLSLDQNIQNYVELAANNPSNRSVLYNRYGNTLDVNITGSTAVSLTSLNQIAITVANNDFALYLNGTSQGTDTSATLAPTLASLEIGRYNEGSPGGYLNGTISKIAYYPLRVTNAQLQALTS